MSTSLTHPVGSKPRASPIIAARTFSIQEGEAGLYHRIASQEPRQKDELARALYLHENCERALSADDQLDAHDPSDAHVPYVMHILSAG